MSNPILDTVLGLSFVFLIGALMTSAVVEWFANLRQKRAKTLLVGLREMLNPTTSTTATTTPRKTDAVMGRIAPGAIQERNLNAKALVATPTSSTAADTAATATLSVEDILGHGLIQPFKPIRWGKKTRNPSYIPGDVIAKVMVDLLDPEHEAETLKQLEAKVDTLPGSLQSALRGLIRAADGQIDKFRDGIEHWYDAQMDRISGIYKRWAKWVSIVVAIGVVGFFHVDAIAIAQNLWTNEPTRNAVVAAAVGSKLCTPASGTTGTTDSGDQNLTKLRECITGLQTDGLPIGTQQWFTSPADVGGWLLLIVGLAASVMAISMGAPFWFGAMNRLISVRNAGTKPSSTTQ